MNRLTIGGYNQQFNHSFSIIFVSNQCARKIQAFSCRNPIELFLNVLFLSFVPSSITFKLYN